MTATVFLQSVEHSVGHTICKIANEFSASVIVMGHRDLGAIRRTLLGSVSDYVLHHSHIPTVVVPPEAEKSETKH